MELPVQQVPGEGRRRIWRRGQLVALGRVVAGEEGDSVFVDALAEHRRADRSARLDGGQPHSVGFGDAPALSFANPSAQQGKPAIVEPIDVEVGAAVPLPGSVLLTHCRQVLVVWSCHRANGPPGRPGLWLPTGSNRPTIAWENSVMTVIS